MLSVATPGSENENPENPETVNLFINEFMAINDNVIQDETDSYEDWLEIYNPGPDSVEMLGLFLTDDPANTTQWSFPDTTMAAGSFLLVWCDNDENDGPLHTNFKLSGDGEEIGLYGRLAAGNEVIDNYGFGPQTVDTSEGRATDGSSTWRYFGSPTPGESNGSPEDCCVDRGNVDDNEPPGTAVNVSDLTYLVAFLFSGGPTPPCQEAANVDASSNGTINISDLTYLVAYLFSGGPEPPEC